MKVSGSDFNSSVIRREELLFSCALRDQNSSTINKSGSESEPEPHAHAHAHAIFISTTTKPLPDSATNTDYDTLTLTAFTTTPICNLLQPGTDAGLPCPLSASLGTRARMAQKIAKFGPQFGDSCNCVGAAVQVCHCPWL